MGFCSSLTDGIGENEMRNYSRMMLFASVSALATSLPAFGQEAKQASDAKVEAAYNNDGAIVVTALRREERLERTPVSVAVLTPEALTKRAVVSEADLQVTLPGVTVRASQNSNNLNYAIRGQSLDVFSNTRPGVLPYFNEVPIGGGIGGSSAFYDLATIQVLKGPQGTLFGRNATGGAVLLTTAKPTDEFGGYAMGRLGNYDLRYLEGAINLPISESARLRLAGVRHTRNGFQKNVHPNCENPHPIFPIGTDPDVTTSDFEGCRVGDIDRTGLRGTLEFEPTDNVQNTLVLDYLHSGGSSTSAVLYSLDPTGAIPLIALTDLRPSNVTEPGPNGIPMFEAILGAFAGNPALAVGQAAIYRAATPNLPEGGLAEFLEIQKQRGPYTVDLDGPQDYNARNFLVSNITTVDVGDNTKLKNVFGYINTRSTIFNDVDAVPFGIDNNGFFRKDNNDDPYGRIDEYRSYSNELQILGKAFEDRLDYIAGVYISDEKYTAITGSDFFDFPLIRNIQINAAVTSNTTYAGFAQGTLNLDQWLGTNGLSFTAGARYTDEKINIRYLDRDISRSAPEEEQATFDNDQTRKFHSFSWTLGLQYQVDPQTLLYTASRRSFRHGGFNYFQKPVPGFGEDGGNAYRTEQVTDLEFGIKKQGRIGVPYRFSLAAYQSWIEDAQRVAYILRGSTPVAITVNVPAARVRGFEFDGELGFADWLKVGGQVNYTDAKFTDSLVRIGGVAPVEFGNYPDTPEWSGSVYADVSVPVTQSLKLSLRGDVYHQSSVSTSALGDRNPATTLPNYTLVNFRLGIENEAQGWSLAGTVRNAFKETYYVGGVPLGKLFQINTAVPGEPRTFAVEARYKF